LSCHDGAKTKVKKHTSRRKSNNNETMQHGGQQRANPIYLQVVQPERKAKQKQKSTGETANSNTLTISWEDKIQRFTCRSFKQKGTKNKSQPVRPQ